MSALKLEELYRMLTLSAVEEEILTDCWLRTPNPEVGTDEINWISNILMNESMFKHYSKEQKQSLFKKTLKAYNQISFIDDKGKPLNPCTALFMCLDLTSAIKNTEDFLTTKLSSVVVYNTDKVRKLDNKGGLLFSRGTQVFIDFLLYSIHLIKFYDEVFSQSFENPLKDMSPKVTIDNIEDLAPEDLKHFKKYIKNGKERLKQIKDKRNKINKIISWTEKLAQKPVLNKTIKMQLLSQISSLNAELHQEELKYPKSLFLSETEISEFEVLNKSLGYIKAFSNIPFSGLTKEIVDCIKSCKLDTEYSAHISLPKYLSDLSSSSSNILIHEISHLIDQEIQETSYGAYDWSEKLKKYSLEKDFSLGSYALTNKKEFFAVSVENFIQNSGSFKKDFPQIYNRLQSIINESPTSRNPLSKLSLEIIKKQSN